MKGQEKRVRLWQYSTKASKNMEPFAWQAAGMGYIIHTNANRFVVIDGGHGEDAEGLIRLMQRESGDECPEIAMWILTHPHDDHADALIRIAGCETLKSKVNIRRIAFNLPVTFPQNRGADCERTLQAIHLLPEELPCEHICPKTGDKIEVDGLQFEFFFCQDDLECTDPNELSLVFRVSGTGLKKSVMFTGDAYPLTMDRIMKKYTTQQLRSEICQAAHHGLNGGGSAFYQAVAADTVLVPIAVPAFEAMLYGEYKDDPQADANRTLMLGVMESGNRLFRSADGDCCIELE